MSLFDLLDKNDFSECATATPETVATASLKNTPNNKQITTESLINGSSVAGVASVAVANSRKLKASETKRLINWLHHIGENNPSEITHTISQCETDPNTKAWFMSRANKLSLTKIGQS